MLELWKEVSAISPHSWALSSEIKPIHIEPDLFFVKHKDRMLTKNRKKPVDGNYWLVRGWDGFKRPSWP